MRRNVQPTLIFNVEERCRFLRQCGVPRSRQARPDPAAAYVFAWNKLGRKGQPCRLTARGGFNSCRLEFADGFVMITSRNSIRRLSAAHQAGGAACGPIGAEEDCHAD